MTKRTGKYVMIHSCGRCSLTSWPLAAPPIPPKEPCHAD
jgi:hypothetical protein